MFSPLRNRFGIPGVISVIALVFALFGGAYAASNSGDGTSLSAKQSNKKAKRGPRGPRGKQGPMGPAGPAGPQGPAGAKGANGANGKDGVDGEDGTNGKNVEVGTPTGEECANGGATVQVAGEPATKKAVCNGEDGVVGTLGSGETETGSWALKEGGETLATISFNIPLAAELSAANVHFVTSPGGSCTGSAVNPTAASGHLCVYKGPNGSMASPFIYKTGSAAEPLPGLVVPEEGASKSGAVLVGAVLGGEASTLVTGTWAVTG